jgi:hypothetical protein
MMSHSSFFDPHTGSERESGMVPHEAWDVALICRNGHLINDRSRGNPAANVNRCSICGAEPIGACPGCREPIRGFHYQEREQTGSPDKPIGTPLGSVPQYCDGCGRPLPWTERAMSAARALIRELAALDSYERDLLRRSIDHIVRETPQTPLAILRIRTALSRVEGETAAALRELLLSVANDAVKQRLFA